MPELLRIGFIGLGATLVMDLWAAALARLLKVSGLDYRLVGRWIGHMPRGRFAHDTIVEAVPTPNEKWLGWAAHYVTGIAFAWLFASLVDQDWFAAPRPEVAVLFGLGTVVFPFLVMQPAFGFGVAASRAADPLTARLRSLTTHAVFGFGLYLAALLLARL
jgi:hypothetical protein